ncbi:nitrous oxide reductase accessory protein NosL [Algoriphagus marinus]|uniref:nitrous oxide reductase accessory protein NosL n=1 Tax=Algoriphagus marinus TaxID=1925762 RepID=UPI000ADCAD30|nr:nitrous oxide reductase accessory protein NosL [Algoriphagus marinus]
MKIKTLFTFLFLLTILASCSTDPRPIAFGEDLCHHCKMMLVDPKFGAEVVTEKGKIFVFDDTNCLISFLENTETELADLKHILVVDYQNSGSLLEATTSFYLKSEEFRTPMNSQVIAFSHYDSLKSFKKTSGGVYLAWGELVTQFK